MEYNINELVSVDNGNKFGIIRRVYDDVSSHYIILGNTFYHNRVSRKLSICGTEVRGRLDGKNLRCDIVGYGEIIITLNTDQIYNTDLKPLITEKVSKFIFDKDAKEKRGKELAENAKSFKPEIITYPEPEDVAFSPTGSDLQTKFSDIVCATNSTISDINNSNTLGAKEELANAFIKAREEVSKYTEYSPGTVMTFASKYVGDTKWFKKATRKAKEATQESASVKVNIDQLFGLIQEKYTKLLKTAEELQAHKGVLKGQILAIEALAKESDIEISQYETQSDIPIATLALNSQIKGSVEKYRNRLTKLEGAIVATQATVTALGRDIPTYKADLEEEMALGSLLSNIDDYQKMSSEIASLVESVTATTREATFEVVENLMDIQINDLHMTKAITENIEAGNKFGKMLSEKSALLADKVTRDANFISQVVSGKAIEDIKIEFPMLKG